MTHGPPRKFWDYDSLIGAIIAAVKRYVESKPASERWESIHFLLRNDEHYPYEIGVIRRGETESWEAAPEVDQLVRSLADLLRNRPQEKWSSLRIDMVEPTSSIVRLR